MKPETSFKYYIRSSFFGCLLNLAEYLTSEGVENLVVNSEEGEHTMTIWPNQTKHAASPLPLLLDGFLDETSGHYFNVSIYHSLT